MRSTLQLYTPGADYVVLDILRAVRYFGGDLRVESTEGIGTDAFLYLPRLQDEHEALA